jgi:Fuc2NAc and GlcNAc transferase
MTGSVASPGFAVVAAALVSAAGTAVALAYARRRGLLDAPGRRRSHRVPTPRGGGVGLVVSILAVAPWLGVEAARAAWAPIIAAFVAVAAIGWLDDHRPLPARLRFVVHLLAAVAVAGAALGAPGDAAAHVLFAVAVLAVAWSINLHNFIDGIDGLLGLHAVAFCAVLGLWALHAGDRELALLSLCVAGAALGFLPFNLPRARIFMGDIGSGALGLAIGVLALLAWRRGVLDPGALLLLASAPGIDATATLLSRMLRGRAWHRPHREHLYQWLVRRGQPHARVALAYAAWTALAMPAWLLAREGVAAALPRGGSELLYFVGWPALGLLAGGLVWWAGKRACLRRPERSRT